MKRESKKMEIDIKVAGTPGTLGYLFDCMNAMGMTEIPENATINGNVFKSRGQQAQKRNSNYM